MKLTLLSTLLLPLASAHFELTAPKARDFNEDTMPQFPCGGFNTVSATRTPFPLKNGSVTVVAGHSNTNFEVLIAFGNTPGSAFNTIIRRPFFANGLGNLCIGNLTLPANITAGTNATIQVQSNGDPDGGLYACADITFSSDVQSTGGTCSTGAFAISAATVSGHPNGTAFDVAAKGASPTTSGTAATAKPTGGAGAVGVTMGGVLAAAAGVAALVL